MARGGLKRGESPENPNKPAIPDWDMDGSDSDKGEVLSTEQMIQSLYKGMKKINENVCVVREELDGIKHSIEANYVELK